MKFENGLVKFSVCRVIAWLLQSICASRRMKIRVDLPCKVTKVCCLLLLVVESAGRSKNVPKRGAAKKSYRIQRDGQQGDPRSALKTKTMQ